MRRVLRLGLLVVAGYALACGPHDATTRLTFSGSALGPEGDVIRRQLARFADRHPGVGVELQVTPDSDVTTVPFAGFFDESWQFNKR